MLLLLLLSVTFVTVNQRSSISSSKYTQHDWYETAIFYHIYPRSFKDSDGDGIGDIKGKIQPVAILNAFIDISVEIAGIISKLDHLKEMGVAGAWLSPIFKYVVNICTVSL